MKGAKYCLGMVAAIAIGVAVWMIPGSANAYFSGTLVECSQVTQPALLSTCATTPAGQDPLTRGVATIDEEGDLDIVLVGAGAGQTYTAFFRSIDGNQFQIATVVTGPEGNGVKSKYAEFPFGKNGAGSIVLTRNGVDQYVTSLFVEPSGSDITRASFHVQLMSCGAVNDPDTITTGCGGDVFKGGSVDVRSDTGAVTVQVNGAETSATYSVILRSPTAGTPLSLGTVGPTDSNGNAQSTSATVFFSTIASGTVVLTRNGADQAYGGFRVTQKAPKRPATGSGLVQCSYVTVPGPLSESNCGTDGLTSGSAILSQSGILTVTLTGALPSTSYEVFFRPTDSDGSADVDTKLSLTTGSNGNAKGSVQAVTSGTGSGIFVVKGVGDNAGLDEFLSGFSIQ